MSTPLKICDTKQRSCQKWDWKNDFQSLFLHMKWSGLTSNVGHFSPKFQILYEENKRQKKIFWMKATKFLSLKLFRIVRSSKLCLQEGHAPTTYWPLVSHKVNISDRKIKKLYEEDNHLSKIFPIKLTRFLQLNLFAW